MKVIELSTGKEFTAMYGTTPAGHKRMNVEGKFYTDKQFGKLFRSKETQLVFKINTPAFLKEITDGAIQSGGSMGVLFVPLNQFRLYLCQIADRCAEINDPVLNMIMCNMALYDQADPFSKDYDSSMVDAAQFNYTKYMAKKLAK